MKKALITLLAVVLVTVGLVSGVAALPPGEWVSGITVANPNPTEASVWLTFYGQDGSEVLSFDGGTIGADAAKFWYLPAHVDGLPDAFIGSAVVASDLPVAATVNTQLPSGTSPMRAGTSIGVDSPGATVYATQLPNLYFGWNSYCAVQNTGATAFDVTARFYGSDGSEAHAVTRNVPAYANTLFDLQAIPELGTNMYSAKFEGSASNPLAVVCNYYNSGDSAATAQFHSYNGMAEGAQTLYVPRVVKDYYLYQSGLRVQNIGSEDLTVTVTYSFGGNTYEQVSPTMAPGQAWGPFFGDEQQLPPAMAGVSGTGSAVVTINDPTLDKAIIATVNEENRVNPAGLGVTYEAALPTDATDTVVFPQIVSQYYGYSGGFQVSKTSAGDLSCSACYSAFGEVSAFCENFQLTDANPSWSQFAPDASGMLAGYDNYNGAVSVSCPGGTIIGISNMSFRYDRDNRYGEILGDSYITARGINK